MELDKVGLLLKEGLEEVERMIQMELLEQLIKDSLERMAVVVE